METDATMRIGEVARRTGTSVPTLRAWERRYGVLRPDRTDGGHRLYSDDDVARVLHVQALIDDGWSVGAAARHLAAPAGPTTTGAEALVERLQRSLDDFDARETERALDDAFARFDPPAALDAVLVPLLRWLGEGWQDDPRVIAREHFATNAVRTRLHRLLRATPTSSARRVVAASPPGEDHDLGLMAASVALAGVGWRVHFLGANTPVAAIEGAMRSVDASLLLLAAVARGPAQALLDAGMDTGGRLAVVGGPGFREGDVDRLAPAIHHDGPFGALPLRVEQALGLADAG